ncbi:MAG: hypothetical protein PUC65_03655 [Clostridiales bacterium]|nr:hypothetical protein [Clostridiales bacterium]
MVKKKKVIEPQYYTSATMMQTLNYKVYYMSFKEKIMYFMLAFIVGAVVGYIFYGGIGKDEFGNSTTTTYILNTIFMVITGLIAGKLFLPIRVEQLRDKRLNTLRLQFRELLDSLCSSLEGGKNIVDSFKMAEHDMETLYGTESFIQNEIRVILSGLANNNAIEQMLLDFGSRSGIDDIVNFANVFDTCYRSGGNIRDVILNTKQIINDKMEVELEIQTVVASSKMEQNIMTVMPIGIIALIKLSNPDLAKNYGTPAGIIVTTISIVIFVVSALVAKIVLKVKI